MPRNIAQEFAQYFGNESKLENWQRLCRDVGIEQELRSIKKCREALRTVWVNIHDLLDAIRDDEFPVRRFRNKQELHNYTFTHRRIFPKRKAKESGPVRYLLTDFSR